MTIESSIIANSPSGGNCSGPTLVSSQGYNVVDDSSCNFLSPGDLQNTDPRLGPLAADNGPTVGASGQTSVLQTQAPRPGSPAIDHISPSICPPPASDERGVVRPQGATCDSGAVEFVPGSCQTGDVNCDGVVDSLDALCALRIVALLPSANARPIPPPGDADVDGDGDLPPGADSTDALCILRHVAHLPATAACPAF